MYQVIYKVRFLVMYQIINPPIEYLSYVPIDEPSVELSIQD